MLRLERQFTYHVYPLNVPHVDLASAFFFQAEAGIRDGPVTGVQTCALPIYLSRQHVGVGAAHEQDGAGDGAPERPEIDRVTPLPGAHGIAQRAVVLPGEATR